MEKSSLESPLVPSNEDERGSVKVIAEVQKQLGLAGPVMATSILQILLQVISLMFVGHIDELALSGAALAFSFVTLTGFSILSGMTCALDTLCGQSFGARQYHMLGIHLQRSMFISVLIGIPVAIVWTFTGDILMALGQDPEISTEAGNFARFLIPSIFSCGILFSINKFLQTQSKVFPMMLACAFTSALHILLCWTLVSKFELGSKGAAVATDISYLINVLFLAAYVKYSPSCSKTWTGFSRYALLDLGNYIKLALPSIVMVCMVYWSFEMLVFLSGFLPNPKLNTSAMSICYNISQLLFTIPFGLSTAASIRVSNELGAGRPQSARLAVWVAVTMAVIQGLLVGVPVVLLRGILGYAYSNEEEVVKYVALMMPSLAIANFLDGVQFAFSGVARGCGWQKICAFINLGAYYVVGAPLSVLFAFFLHLRGIGLWSGLICGLTVQTFLLIIITICTSWEKEANNAKDRVYEAAATANEAT